MPTKWLQERANGSKNEHGMTPRRAFCGNRVGSIASSRAGCPPRLHVAALESRLITCHHTDGEQHPTETILGYRKTVSELCTGKPSLTVRGEGATASRMVFSGSSTSNCQRRFQKSIKTGGGSWPVGTCTANVYRLRHFRGQRRCTPFYGVPRISSGRVFVIDARSQRKVLQSWLILDIIEQHLVKVGPIDAKPECL